jgi:hypothetical protein
MPQELEGDIGESYSTDKYKHCYAIRKMTGQPFLITSEQTGYI